MGPSALLDLSARASGRVAKNRARGRRQSALFFATRPEARADKSAIVHEGAMALIDL